MVDTNDILNGDGPMAPTRTGSIPAVDMIRLSFSGKTEKELMKFVRSQGGLYDHLGTFDAREVVARIKDGDIYAKNVYDAMIYQIGKYVGSMYAAMNCKLDGIVLTGGMAYDEYLVDKLKKQVGAMAPVAVLPGEFEMEALAHGVYDALVHNNAYEYTGVPVWTEKELYESAEA